ncbi:MAG: hypothetical protein OEW68_13225 [Gammaproteobacteria bacterium]|nr:hypothetical protein [Gammaproteobacteria bacterium]MDH4315794.1 hypothetical protein [Gammaproteobacteria bacterium]MDH5214732.1 hypothetical protein [Gammaproteobacteria bacterium]
MPRIAIVVALLVPALALSLYTMLGTPQAASSQGNVMSDNGEVATSSRSSTAPKKVDSVGNMLERLERRLEGEPDDAGGWLLLARSYHHLDRISDAGVAYEKAVALGKTDTAFEKLLRAETGDTKAVDHSSTGLTIKGRVSIADEVAVEIEPMATVFVFAKAVNGSAMPLAVVRRSVSELPFEFALDDSLAMVAGMTISSAEQVEVSAKISSTGNAMQPDEGIEANSGAIKVADAEYLELQITRKK